MTYAIHIGPNIRKSPFFEATVAAGVKSFSVYNHMFIPGNFGDPEAEYDRLLNGVAMWDVAAQRQVELVGPDAAKLMQYLTPRALGDLKPGQGRYVPICDHQGYLINDPVMLPLAEDQVWLSVADSDLHLWCGAIAAERGFDVAVNEPDVSPLAIQGPKAMDVAAALFGSWVHDLRYFAFRETQLDGIPVVVARSGWSKQGGVELYLRDSAFGDALWHKVAQAGAPFDIGPGAPNDVERLESGLISYGGDMRRQSLPVDPFEMGFGKMIDLNSHDFVGRAALARIKVDGPRRRRTGVILDGSPVSGNEHPLALMQAGAKVGVVSEIAFSKRLQASIGVGLVAAEVPKDCETLSVSIAGEHRSLRLCDLPFV